MHDLPTGESPGWASRFWANLSVSEGNVWNAPTTVRRKDNGQNLFYFADFEQTTLAANIGIQLAPDFAFALDIPVVMRSGGIMDHIIDEFHQMIKVHRFNREAYGFDESHFNVATNGQSSLSAGEVGGVSHVKGKIKYWPIKWGKDCACGLGMSVQLKAPLGGVEQGLDSGGWDSSFLAHIGIPLHGDGAVYITAGATWVPQNRAFYDWPRNQVLYMTEWAFDLPISQRWAITVWDRLESPLIKRTAVDISYQTRTPGDQLDELISSGWDALVMWRNYVSVGVRYQAAPNQTWYFEMVEDVGLGRGADGTDDINYANGAPDILFDLRFSYAF
jgi:hypothetical protein